MYLDLVLLLNMVANFFLLQLTALITRQSGYPMRLLLASFAGALFPLFIYLIEASTLVVWLIRVLLPLLMVCISFRPKQFRHLFCQYLVFYLCSISLGGLAFLFSSGEQIAYNGGEAFLLSPPSLLRLCFAAAFLYAGIRWLYPLVQEIFHFRLPPAALEMEIQFNGKTKRLTAFIDTGNMLQSPFSSTPVAVAAFHSISELLPQDIRSFLACKGSMDWLNLEPLLCRSKNAGKFNLIPYHTLRDEGFLLAFRPDEVRLMDKGGAEVAKIRLLVAVQQEDGERADYEVLLPLETWRTFTALKRERKIALI